KSAQHGTITIQVHHHHHQKAAGLKKKPGQVEAVKAVAAKKAPQPANKPHHPKTYHVNKHTKFSADIHSGGRSMTTHPTFANIHKGQHVVIHAHGHTAKHVKIVHHLKQKKPKSPGMRKKGK